MNLGAPELLILLVVVLLLFGATRLPKLARSMGEASREFKKGVAESSSGEEPPPAAAPAEAEKVTLTKAELDAMLAEREAQARKDAPPST